MGLIPPQMSETDFKMEQPKKSFRLIHQLEG